MFKSLIGPVAIATLAIALAAPAHSRSAWLKTMSDNHGGYPRVAIDYADLDLATAQGQNELRDRTRVAARTVCDLEGHSSNSIMVCIRDVNHELRKVAAAKIAMATRKTQLAKLGEQR